ncbi:MAG: hypothetical protein RL380_1777, partial [Verrucomicrobiota bacterium]
MTAEIMETNPLGQAAGAGAAAPNPGSDGGMTGLGGTSGNGVPAGAPMLGVISTGGFGGGVN